MRKLNYNFKGVSDTLINFPRNVGSHMLTEKHSLTHRIIVGVIIMSSGVCLANIHSEYATMNLIAEGVGYTFHAIGSLPIVEHILHHYNNGSEQK